MVATATPNEIQALEAAIDSLEDMIEGGSEDQRHPKQLLALKGLLKKLKPQSNNDRN